MPEPRSNDTSISGLVDCWCLLTEADIDVSFLKRRHRRRLSLTTRLALSAYHRCNPELTAFRTVFASRYGEYIRTYGILQDLAIEEPASPAAFSVSVHNAPGGIVGIATSNSEPSTTISCGAATVEAGFLEAAMQHAELNGREDIVFVYVDEPLPSTYGRFVGAAVPAYAVGLKLAADAERELHLAWSKASTTERGPDGIPEIGYEIVSMLKTGRGKCASNDGRLMWNWSVERK